MDASGGEAGDRVSRSICHSDFWAPIDFEKSQDSSLYEAFNSLCLSRGHSDVRPPVQMTLTPTAFSRFPTQFSDMSSFCEMKEKPEFMPLQGNRAFF